MLKEGYKKYEFGYIPNDWKIKKIGDIYDDLKAGATPSRTNPSYFTGDIPWITSGELKSKYIYDTYEKITEEAVKNTNLKIYQKGTFFIAITGLEAAGTRGSCGINGIDSATNQSCLAFQEKEEINTEFLYYWYSLYGDYIGKKYTQGTKQQSLNNKIVEELCIGFPNKEEQEKIADILSTVDCQIDDTEMFIEKCQELKKGLMQKLLTKGIGHTEFKKTEVGEIPVDWEVVKIRSIANVKSSKRVYKNDYIEEGVPFYRSKEIIELSKNIEPTVELFIDKFKYNEFKKKFGAPKKGDLLITSVGSVGITWVSDGREFYYKDGNLTQIDNNENINTKFISYLFSTDFIKKQYLGQSNGSAQVALTLEKLRELKLPIPILKEQEEIVNILIQIDNEIDEYKNKKQKLYLLKKGLMQHLLTGKVRTI